MCACWTAERVCCPVCSVAPSARHFSLGMAHHILWPGEQQAMWRWRLQSGGRRQVWQANPARSRVQAGCGAQGRLASLSVSGVLALWHASQGIGGPGEPSESRPACESGMLGSTGPPVHVLMKPKTSCSSPRCLDADALDEGSDWLLCAASCSTPLTQLLLCCAAPWRRKSA